jgi:hypothetical protein
MLTIPIERDLATSVNVRNVVTPFHVGKEFVARRNAAPIAGAGSGCCAKAPLFIAGFRKQ